MDPSAPKYSTLEASYAHDDGEGLQLYDHPGHTTPSYRDNADYHPLIIESQTFPSTKSHKIWGSKRKIMALGALLAFVALVAIGVGVGIGVTRGDLAKDKPEEGPIISGLSITSHLASVNWTSTEGNIGTNYWVYFQDNTTGALYQSKWESKHSKWTVSPITLQGSINGKSQDLEVHKNTPIAGIIYDEGDSAERRIYFLDNQMALVELSSESNSDGDGKWTLKTDNGALVEAFAANGLSSLPPVAATWSKTYKDDDDDTDIKGNITVAFVQDNRYLSFCESFGGWTCHSTQWESPIPVRSSPLLLVPVQPQAGPDRLTDLNLYLNGGKIREAGWWVGDQDISDGWQVASEIETSPDTIDGSISLTGFSYGYNYANREVEEIQVIVSRPDDGGVSVTRWNGEARKWSDPTNPTALDEIQGNSPLAANQDRRLYSIIEENSIIKLVEYSSDETGTWSKIGEVDSAIPR